MFPNKIRADLRVNDGWRKLVLAPGDNEKPQHLGLKLAAYLLFWAEDLTVDPSVKHPALAGQDFRPDLLGVDVSGAVSLWVECGNTSQNKLTKVLRRWPQARVVVVKEAPGEARRFRQVLSEGVPRSERVEVYAWPEGRFGDWMRCLSEKTEVFGESGGVGLNLVVNEQVYVADLVRF